jgi:hypothetical protein
MHLSRTGEAFDISQSYWTYWHWYDEVINGFGDEIETGGSEGVSFQIIRERGLMAEADFIPEDSVSEMSSRQSTALDKMNAELKTGGRLDTASKRSNRKLVRQVLNDAWGLSEDVKKQLDTAFGTTGKRTYLTSATAKGTKIIRAKDFTVRTPSARPTRTRRPSRTPTCSPRSGTGGPRAIRSTAPGAATSRSASRRRSTTRSPSSSRGASISTRWRATARARSEARSTSTR